MQGEGYGQDNCVTGWRQTRTENMKKSLIDRRAVERLLLLAGALQAGLIDALAASEPASADTVAAAAGSDPRATFLVLEALVEEGLVERAGSGRGEVGSVGESLGLYRLTSEARDHLLPGGRRPERYGILHQASKLRGWLELPLVIRSGKPGPRDPARKDRSVMVRAMGERDPEIVSEIVERCLAYAGPVRSMVDIGGAVGHVARAFWRRGVRATLFDREEVLPHARDFLGADADHLTLVGGDFTEALPSGVFDLAYFGNVHHIYSPAVAARMTSQAFAILAPGGTIAVQDYVWGRSPRAAMFAVNMLQSTEEGGVWTEKQFRTWLQEAGFQQVEVLDLKTNEAQLILGRRPPGGGGEEPRGGKRNGREGGKDGKSC